tara:strand:+ start:339 stop:908 length:570 start_codon:yes stop_codon:yes gene_type:complete
MEDKLKKIGLRLKAVRKSLTNLQSQDFAKILNIAPSTYSQHEKGKRSPSIESILKYAEYYKIHPEWILTGNSCITNPYDRENEIKVRNKALVLGLEDNVYMPQIKSNSHSVVDVEILLIIFSEMINVSTSTSLSLNIQELQEFCIDIYNNVSILDTSIEDKKNMISLAVDSLVKGLKKSKQLSKQVHNF